MIDFLEKLTGYQNDLGRINPDLMIEIYYGSSDGCFKCSISKYEFINSDKKFVYVPKIPFDTIEELFKYLDDAFMEDKSKKYLRNLWTI